MKAQQGFTLIELAIVLVIVTILVGGLAMPLSAQIQARRIGETRKTMEEAKEAIIGYAMSHTTGSCTCAYVTGALQGSSTCSASLCSTTFSTSDTATLTVRPRHYLPCPDINKAADDLEPAVDNDGVNGLIDINNGVEDRYISGTNSGQCITSLGNFPWVTLATAPQDAWGNRLRYAITAAYADLDVGFGNTLAGDKQICSTSTGGCPTGTVASNVPAVLIAYGPNGWGALNVSGTPLAAPTSADELENTDADNSFVSRFPSKSDAAAGEFDDLLVWISKDLLISRVCQGGCP